MGVTSLDYRLFVLSVKEQITREWACPLFPQLLKLSCCLRYLAIDIRSLSQYISIYIESIWFDMTTHAFPRPVPIFLTMLGNSLRWQLVAVLARSDRRAQELVVALGQPANLVSYHLKRLQQARLVRQRRSAADRRAIYYSLNLPEVQALYAQAGRALHPALD